MKKIIHILVRKNNKNKINKKTNLHNLCFKNHYKNQLKQNNYNKVLNYKIVKHLNKKKHCINNYQIA